jgi:mono/diheme cytochrome c family protein
LLLDCFLIDMTAPNNADMLRRCLARGSAGGGFCLILMLLLPLWLVPHWVAAGEPIDFVQQIAPIFQTHCIRCHSPGNEKGGVSVANFTDLRESDHVIPGDPDASHLLEMISSVDSGPPEMPKDSTPLSAEEIALIRDWITAGAVWPDEVIIREKSKADASWWSLQPLNRTAPELDQEHAKTSLADLPSEVTQSWLSNPIDRFVLAKLIEQGLHPNEPADRRSLIRRATYDLTGLPPSPEDVEAFVASSDPLAYELLIDRLLASPNYGQRWGRHWLDVVRFGESNGFERNVLINNLWPFRDYVIDSINRDKPFELFVREHLAGDVFGKDQVETEIGVAFLVAGPYDDVGNQDAAQAAQIRADTIDEMIRSSSEAFLGLTVGCSRCHDHKFDPISQADYYSLYATFAGVRHGARVLATPQQRATHAAAIEPHNRRKNEIEQQIKELGEENTDQSSELQSELAEVNRQIAAVSPLPSVWIGNRAAAEGPFHLFLGGSPQRPGEKVQPSSLSAFGAVVPSYQLCDEADESKRRQALADWIVHTDNPLTPRVLANRVWHYHFGTGIVDTPSDFGYMGGQPTHPQLLDWLAAQLQAGGWQLKPLHKKIMLSQTYRQSSTYREAAARIDGDARLLWRFPPRRLSAEEIRDTVLVAAGQLDSKMGGPGFRLYQFVQDNVCTYTPLDRHQPSTYRRAVYHQNARASIVDLMSDFDQPDCAFSTPKRAETTTPLQALTMLNHTFTFEMAGYLAERLKREAGTNASDQIACAFAICYSRSPDNDEVAECQELLEQYGLVALCRVLLNTSEMIYVQ